MKRRLALAAVVFVLTACASAPRHLEGRYALVFGNVRSERGEFQSDVREALAGRLTTVDVVADTAAASGYDAVIVIHPIEYSRVGGGYTETRVRGDQGVLTNVSAPMAQAADGSSYPQAYPTSSVSFDIVRTGKPNVSGAIVAVFPWGKSVSEVEPSQRSAHVAAAKTLAEAIVKKLSI